MDISVVIPLFNEEESLPELYAWIERVMPVSYTHLDVYKRQFYALSERFHLPFEFRLFLTTGLCGGFTTFSTFSSDGVGLLKGEFYGAFVLYTLLSIGIGLAATLAGGYVGKQI